FSTQMIANKVQVKQLQAQIIDLQQSQTDGQTTRQLAIQESVQNLSNQLQEWQQNYLIKAPIAGKVNLEKIWSDQQFISAGEPLLTIVPAEGTGKIIAKAQVPTANSGKVEVGQTVNIRLNGYPYQEFGILKATVKQIALVPQEESYTVTLKMPEVLVTTYDKTIPFAQEMQGTAAIITEDRSILQRIFDRFWSLLKNV
ncbi:MAG: HlyD family efflux transporter periplasmic adaptor subunit, partial [Bacteroidota bacterium]